MSTFDPSGPGDPSTRAVSSTPQDATLDPVPQTAAPAATPYSGGPAAPTSAPLPARMRGPNLALMFTGLFALAVATFGLTRRVLNVDVDWARYGTAALIGVGLLAALVGLIGVIRRR
jgi:hypothetical protein